jgi:signal transduction histidine kinase
MYTVVAPPAQVEYWSMPQSTEFLLNNLAHELRQPLSTIESIAYYLELALPHSDPRVIEQLTRLRHLVEQSGWIVSDAIALSKSPCPLPGVVDLDEIVSEFVLEQMQHDSHRPHFELELGGSPAWIDVQQARELVSGICRLFRTLAKPGTEVRISTRVISCGSILLQARTEAEETTLPPGANLTLEWIERLAVQNSASVFMNLSDPQRLELAVEVPAAPRSAQAEAELDEALPSFEIAAPLEPTAPGIL